MAVLAALVWPVTAGAQEDEGEAPGLHIEDERVTVLGALPEPEERSNETILGVVGDRLYYAYNAGNNFAPTHLRAYDLSSPGVPTLLRDEEIGPFQETARSWRPNSVTIAPDQGRLYQLGRENIANQGFSDPADEIHVVDLDSFSLADSWLLAEQGLPGFTAYGITYAPEDDRLYLVGEWAGIPIVGNQFHFTSGHPPVGPVTTVVALEAATGEVAWVRPVPQCPHVMTHWSWGAMVARSAREPAIYFLCDAGGTGYTQAVPGGQSALVRLNISSDAGQGDANGFGLEAFPISGGYGPSEGVATFSRRLDRVYVNSLSNETPGAFVFDGQLSAWVGHIAAPDGTAIQIGVSEGDGRFYLGSQDYLLVTDGAATPPPQTTAVDGLPVNTPIVADPGSDRLFFKVPNIPGSYGDLAERYIVVDFPIEFIDPLPPPDFDAGTADVAEGPDTFVNYTAVSSGFGALGRLVGGVGSVGSYGLDKDVDPFGNLNDLLENQLGQDRMEEPVVVSQGDRGVVAAEVPAVSLAAFGATGDAQALSTDDGSAGEIGEVGNLVGEQGAPAQVTEGARSPYRRVECSDNGFDDDTTDQKDSDDVDAGPAEGTGAGTGHARVVCDRVGQQAQAMASWRAGPAADEAAGPAVAASSFDTHVSRDPEQGGATTETVAVASGLELPLPQGGMLQIGEVRATAVTAAAGRPGTTLARWTRTLSGVVVTDQDGAQRFPEEDGAGSCATVVSIQGGEEEQRQEADNCRQLIDTVENLTEPRITFELPEPDLQATPLGAYAQVRESVGDFRNGATVLGDSHQAVPALQVLVANDGTEKSRLLLHLAAIDTSTTYQIKPCPACSFDGGTDPDPAPAPTTEPASPTPAATATGQPTVESAAAPPPTPPVSLPAQEPEGQSIDLAAAQPSTSEPEVAPQQALSLPGRIGAGLQLLTRDPVQALLVGGVWLLFAGALTTLLRRTRLRQLVSS